MPLITSRIYTFVESFVFISVPMFVLMAAMLDRSGIARDLFDAMTLVGRKLRRGVAVQTLATVGMIVWIGIGATALVGVYNLMGGIRFISDMMTGLSDNPTVIVLVMMVILFVLGAFLDWVGIALLTMPIFVPIIKSLGLDPIWFGVLFCMNMQVSFLSPPFGPAAFYLKSVAPPDISLGEIFAALLPFIGLQMLAVALLIFFPGIAVY